MLIKGMVKIIHKNIYSNRLKTNEEVEPYYYDINDEFTINSFMIFFSKIEDINIITKTIKDFCETKRNFISENTKMYMLHDYPYNVSSIKHDLSQLLFHYETIEVLDFLDIFMNNIESELLDYIKLSEENPYTHNYRRDIIQLTVFKEWFTRSLNELFEHNNLGFQVINGVIATKKSDFLHTEVISKSLTLLVNEEFSGPIEEFKRAIENYTHKDYENTVIEACKAYESTMKAILDKKGVTYDKNSSTASALVNLLKDNGIFKSYLIDSLSKITSILSSGLPVVRNKEAGHGDGAEINEVKRSYASFALDLAGSYIVFLIDRYYETLS
jgi:hypothetical protein